MDDPWKWSNNIYYRETEYSFGVNSLDYYWSFQDDRSHDGLFDDANLFGETLEGLPDDAFVQPGPVSLVDELNLGAEFEPLHIDSLNHVQGNSTHQKMTDMNS